MENSLSDGSIRPPNLFPEKPVCGSRSNSYSKLGKENDKAVYSGCLFNLYSEYIMRNAGLDESQARIKTAGRNISNLRYSDDTTLLAENKEELKSLLIKVKEESEKSQYSKN